MAAHGGRRDAQLPRGFLERQATGYEPRNRCFEERRVRRAEWAPGQLPVQRDAHGKRRLPIHNAGRQVRTEPSGFPERAGIAPGW